METIEDLNQVDAIATQLVAANLGSQSVKSVRSSQTLDSMGRDAQGMGIAMDDIYQAPI